MVKRLNTDFTLVNCLFVAVKLAKNVDPDKYEYINYDIGFISRSQFSWANGNWGKNIIIFSADMSSSVHDYNEKKNTLPLGEGPTQRFSELKQKMQELEQFMAESLWYYRIINESIFCYTLLWFYYLYKVSNGYKVVSTYFFQIFIQEFVG